MAGLHPSPWVRCGGGCGCGPCGRLLQAGVGACPVGGMPLLMDYGLPPSPHAAPNGLPPSPHATPNRLPPSALPLLCRLHHLKAQQRVV